MSEFNPSFPDSSKPLSQSFLDSVDRNIAELQQNLQNQTDKLNDVKIQNAIYVQSLHILSEITKELSLIVPLLTKSSVNIVGQTVSNVGSLVTKANSVVNLLKGLGNV